MNTRFSTGVRLGFAGLALAAAAVAGPAEALEIALTNDDGWTAPGVQAMKEALEAAGHTVTLAAPLTNQSGSSAAVDLAALVVTKEAENEYSVALADGSGSAEPATSGLIAIGIVQEKGYLPDLLVSGINAGNNLGALTQVSGTVGASMAAVASAFNGAVPAIAISTDEPDCDAACQDQHYANVAAFVARLIAHLETKPGFLSREEGLLPQGTGLNINYPPVDPVKGIKVAVQGKTAQLDGTQITGTFRCLTGPCSELAVGESEIGAVDIQPASTDDIKNADTDYFSRGYITIVPTAPDYTAGQPLKFKSVFNSFNSY